MTQDPDPNAPQPEFDQAVTTEYLKTFTFGGQPLKPFSLQRVIIFTNARLFLVPLYDMGDSYSECHMFDAILILFLCSSTDEALQPIRHSCKDVVDAALTWGDTHVVDIDSAGKAAFDIWNHHKSTRAIHRPNGSTTAGN